MGGLKTPADIKAPVPNTDDAPDEATAFALENTSFFTSEAPASGAAVAEEEEGNKNPPREPVAPVTAVEPALENGDIVVLAPAVDVSATLGMPPKLKPTVEAGAVVPMPPKENALPGAGADVAAELSPVA